MYSGKTSQICSDINRARLARHNALIVKYSKDNRYGSGDFIETHGHTRLSSSEANGEMGSLRIVQAEDLSSVEPLEDETNIAIDEGQFYSNLYTTVEKWMNEGKTIYVSALDGDFNRKPMGEISLIIPLSTHIKKLNSICMFCAYNKRGEIKAPYTVRLGENKSIELIGSKELYRSACFECYKKYGQHGSRVSSEIVGGSSCAEAYVSEKERYECLDEGI